MSRPKSMEYTFLGETIPFYQRMKARVLSHVTLITVVCFFIFASASFSLGRLTAPGKVAKNTGVGLGNGEGLQPNIPLRIVRYTFEYNRTFAESSPRANKAWRDLFPPENGYFTDPEIAPERSTLSVYHQLHCLDGIRKGYWAVHDAAVAGAGFDDKDLPMMISPPHIRHCIDLLRQSLMCSADTTVEKKDEEAGGVHGFGVEHRCKHWFQLVDWTTEANRKSS